MKTPAIFAAQPFIDTPLFIALLICTDVGRRLLGNMRAAVCKWVQRLEGGGSSACNWGNEGNNFQTFIKCFFSLLLEGQGAAL